MENIYEYACKAVARAVCMEQAKPDGRFFVYVRLPGGGELTADHHDFEDAERTLRAYAQTGAEYGYGLCEFACIVGHASEGSLPVRVFDSRHME